MNKIPYYNLSSINKRCKTEVIKGFKKNIKTSNFISTSNLFEKEFADYVGANFCCGTSSGTSALHLSLIALGIKSGDEVITVSHTYRSTVAAIHYVQAKPVFVDINSKTFLIDPSLIEEKITCKTKAIIIVHMYGNVAELDKIVSISKKHHLFLIEDCAQAHGSTYKNQHVGTFGDIGTFSFYPSKTLGAFADAGCIVTNNKDIEKNIRKLHSWGEEVIGFNYRMSSIQSDILSVKLKYLNDVVNEKRLVAEYYDKIFGSVFVDPLVQHSYHIYPILVDNREELMYNLKDKLELRCHYPIPVHKLPAYRQGAYLPNTDYVSSRQVSVPIYPGVNFKKVAKILKQHNKYFL